MSYKVLTQFILHVISLKEAWRKPPPFGGGFCRLRVHGGAPKPQQVWRVVAPGLPRAKKDRWGYGEKDE